MGVFDKLKNILFEDVEEEIPVITETSKEEPEKVLPNKPEEVSRFKNINYEKEMDIVEEPIEEEPETSPFQQFDEEEFDRIATINKNRLIERDRKLREEKMELESNHKTIARRETHVEKEEQKEVVTPKKFVPSPVISPVYGILDKNYKKEDILPRASSDGTLPKIMDVDSVREKAFGVLEDEEMPIIKEEVKITNYEDSSIDEEEPKEVELDKHDDKEDKVSDLIEDAIAIDEIENEEPEVDDKEDELESDLFNLIDSMYQDEEE